jgi:hydrogenase maturation protease
VSGAAPHTLSHAGGDGKGEGDFLVIATGNPLRRDDGAAAAAARGLDGEGVRVIVVHQLDPELAGEVSRAAAVAFLDVRVGERAGEVRTLLLGREPGRAALTHTFPPEAVLALAEWLHGAAPPAALVTVVGRNYGLGEGVSPEVEAALPALRAAVLAFLRGAVTTPSPTRG